MAFLNILNLSISAGSQLFNYTELTSLFVDTIGLWGLNQTIR